MTTTVPAPAPGAQPARAPRATAADAVRAIGWLCLLAILVVPFASAARALLWQRPLAASAPLALPDRLSYPGWRTPSAERDPRGAASVMMTGSQPPFTTLEDTNAAALIGRGGYRMTPRARTDELHLGSQVLLSPDGRQVVYNGEQVGPFRTPKLQDLTTGRVAPLPLPGGRPALAWLPGGQSVVVGPGEGVGEGDVGIFDLTTRRYRHVAGSGLGSPVLRFDGHTVAVSRDASLLAWQVGDVLCVTRVADGHEVLRRSLPKGTLLGGKGAWTPDATSLAVTHPASGRHRWAVSLLDASTGEPRGEAVREVGDVVSLETLGWRRDGELLVLAYRPERFGHVDPEYPTWYESVRRVDLIGLRPGRSTRTILRAPWQVLAMDVADDAIASHETFANPTPPRVFLPRNAYVGIALVTGGVLALVLWRLARRIR